MRGRQPYAHEMLVANTTTPPVNDRDVGGGGHAGGQRKCGRPHGLCTAAPHSLILSCHELEQRSDRVMEALSLERTEEGGGGSQRSVKPWKESEGWGLGHLASQSVGQCESPLMMSRGVLHHSRERRWWSEDRPI